MLAITHSNKNTAVPIYKGSHIGCAHSFPPKLPVSHTVHNSAVALRWDHCLQMETYHRRTNKHKQPPAPLAGKDPARFVNLPPLNFSGKDPSGPDNLSTIGWNLSPNRTNIPDIPEEPEVVARPQARDGAEEKAPVFWPAMRRKWNSGSTLSDKDQAGPPRVGQLEMPIGTLPPKIENLVALEALCNDRSLSTATVQALLSSHQSSARSSNTSHSSSNSPDPVNHTNGRSRHRTYRSRD